MLHVDLGELAGGTLQEKFDREITRVIENMQDPNTPFGEKRSITINISFHQTEQRDESWQALFLQRRILQWVKI